MPSKDVKTPKTSAEIYKEALGGDINAKPDYIKFMIYAFKNKDEELVGSLLHNKDLFDSKDKVMALLEEHLNPKQTKEKTSWVKRMEERSKASPKKSLTTIE